MPETELQEPERKLNAYQKEANLLRVRRDELNNQARGLADQRDELNGQVRALVNQANEHKKRRDALNEQVQHAKKLRDEYNAEFEDALRKEEDLKAKVLPKGGRSLGFLRRELRRLEFEGMTKVLTPAKEKALMEELGRLHREIRGKEQEISANPELKAAHEAAVQSKERAEKQHEKVGELAQSAQGEHESMVKLFGQSDKIRKGADAFQEKVVVAKLEADKVHKAYIELVEKIHALEDELRKARGGPEGAGVNASREDQQKQADDIFEKFKKGEKLSTEDLMALQKAGLL
jgi:uncharacterized coiled-coil DUF342 family protein